jgi:hypothetical protein
MAASYVRRLAVVMFLGLLAIPVAPAPANHGNADQASSNMFHLAQRAKGGTNSDLAFWGNYAAAGNYGGWRILDISKPANPVVLTDVTCRGPQGDVSFYQAKNRLLLFVSVDTPQTVTGPPPGGKDCASSDTVEATGWEGIRIWDVTSPTAPKFVTAVRTDCGSHTHTTIPDEDNQRALIYVSSYPLAATGVGPNCGQPSPVNGRPHGKISIVAVPDTNPAAANVLKEQHLHLDTIPSAGEDESLVGSVGCHDITVLTEANMAPDQNPRPRREIAAAACLSEGQLWDVSDPANPKTLDPQGHTHIENESIEIWHSAVFTWDGEVVLFGDEHGGGMAPGCGGTQDTTGNIWFYKTVEPPAPAPLLGRYALPRQQLVPPQECTLHNFNVVPLNDNRAYIGVSSAYRGATTVFDFSAAKSAGEAGSPLTAPVLGTEIGFYDAQVGGEADTWSTYWYNDFIYANDGLSRTNQNRGFDVFKILLNGQQLRARKFHHMNPQTQEVFQVQGG